MYSPQPQYGPPPGYGPPPRRSLPARLIAVVFGVVALAGVLCTLLPLWTINVNPDDYSRYGSSSGIETEFAGSMVTLQIGFYDWLTSTALVLAAIPIALAVAVGVAVAQAVRAVPDRNLWGATAALALCVLVLAASVALSPSSAVDVTGELSGELSPRDLTVNQASQLDVGYGAGLVISLIAILAVGAIAAWQYVVTPAEPSP